MEQELVLLYLSTLKREPTEEERTNYLLKLTQGLTTIETIRYDILQSQEYIILQSGTIKVEYDPALGVMEITPNQSSTSYDGVIVANGKLCVKSDKVPYKSQASYIATNYDIEQLSGHNTNLIEGFDLGGIRFFSVQETEWTISDYMQKLHLHTANLTMHYNITHTSSDSSLAITQSIRALQQYPYCFLKTITLQNSQESTLELFVYDSLHHSSDTLDGIEFKNKSVGTDMLYMASGKYTKKNINVFASSLYKFHNGFTNHHVVGVNELGYNVFKVTIEPNTSITFDVISGMMSTADFADPENELVRILTTIKAENLVLDHNTKWNEIWNTANIMITQKTDIDPSVLDEATQSVKLFQRNIKFSLYNIFSIVRDDVNVDMNVLNLSALDKDGEIFWNGEMFLVPVLLILRPRCAEVLLNFRFKQMQFAKSIASVHKNKGSQYPYREDISRYKDLFWSPSRPATAFNTGLIGINAWNYYRVTRDKYWLNEKGFLMIRNCAHFFESLFDDKFNMKKVVTLSGKEETDNALTRYLGIHVIRNYIEACYELGFNVPLEIKNLYDNVKHTLVRLTPEVSLHNGTVLPPKVTVKLGTENEFVFYNTETNELIGSNYGGQTGKHFVVNDNVQYEFTVADLVYFKLYDPTNMVITPENIVRQNALYSTQHGFTDGTFIINGYSLSSYENSFHRLYTHGQNAFTRDSNSVLQNIITRPEVASFNNDNSYKSDNNLLETYMIMMYYYSRTFMNQDYRMNAKETIKSNYLFYGENGVGQKDLIHLDDLLVKGNIECLLAQEMNLYSAKEFFLDLYEKTMYKMMRSDSTFLTRPWGNHDQHVLFIFNLLTSMFKIRIKGTISDHRFYTELFGITRETNTAFMPEYWNHVTVVYNNKSIEIVNDTFFQTS